MKKILSVCLSLTLSLALVACNVPTAAENGSAVSTAAALTVEAALASAASATATPSSALATPEPTRIPGVAIDGTTAEPPATCKENAQIVSWKRDGLTYDKAEVDKRLAPNKGFVMSWEIQNTGNCIWTHQYVFMFISGTPLTAQDSMPVMPAGYSVRTGETLTISVQMSAPPAPGDYETSFSFVNEVGESVMNFGVLTNVGTPSSGKITAPGNLLYTYDCSGGIVSIALNWQDKSSDETGFRIYREGSQVGETSANATTYTDIAPSPGTYLYTVAAFNPSGEAPANVTVDTTNCK
ncbi:MAG: hypothetical protein IPG80_12960 [Anaerolineales bacterium]|jgi:hypothetical protein|uniref:NBR1-Ig-like domain-containing protein n=1 Tax=Candidatus Villigracilis vicinus TaxID=3140679 RepID=UPI00313598C4|nr:hypothetical protein [Anaerolineales bacterium]MBK9781231.1 hypothetical protein [Anaerolineales bacterium]